jgi:hypothetical protein
MTNGLDFADKLAHVPTLALADLRQRVPKLRFQAHAGPAAPSDHIAID